MANDGPPFWLVWNPNGRAPTQKHASADLAEKEAERLARMVPGQEFYVLAPYAEFRFEAMRVRRFVVDEMPF